MIVIGIGRTAASAVSSSIDSRMLSVGSPSARVLAKIAMIPSAKPTSPTRLTRNAFLLAKAAEGRLNQNPMSR